MAAQGRYPSLGAAALTRHCRLFRETEASALLIVSQVILSLQLPFAAIPLILFAGNCRLMGKFRPHPIFIAISWVIAGVIIVLNGLLLVNLTGF